MDKGRVSINSRVLLYLVNGCVLVRELVRLYPVG